MSVNLTIGGLPHPSISNSEMKLCLYRAFNVDYTLVDLYLKNHLSSLTSVINKFITTIKNIHWAPLCPFKTDCQVQQL